MRIAFVVNNYLPRIGGVELHVSWLARKLIERGHQVVVIALSDAPDQVIEDGIKVLRLREHCRIGDVLAFPPLGTTWRLRALIRKEQIDLISVHTRFFPMTWLGELTGQLDRVPVVLTEHGSDHVTSGSFPVRMLARLVDYAIGRQAHRRADAVLGVSEGVVDFVRRLSGVDAELFYNALELPADQQVPAARPNELVFVGRLVAGKGWRTFIDAVTELRRRGFEVHGTLLGGGPDEAAARKYGAEGIDVIGRVAPHEVAQYLAGATLVNPTTLSEGFQTTLLEALAVGGRVVSYPVPGAQALADDGAPVTVTAHRSPVELVESLQTVLMTKSEPYPRALLEKWSWDARAEQFLQIAGRLVDRGNHG